MVSNKRYVTIPTLSWIPALSMFGPIIYPTYIGETTAYNLVRSGFTVIEHAVTGKYAGAKVTLTIKNFYEDNRFASAEGVNVVSNAEKNIGAAVNGQAKAVDPTTKDSPIPVSTANTEAEAENIVPNVASPIAGTMSRSQRKKAAREAARAAAMAASSSNDDVTEDILPTPEDDKNEASSETDDTIIKLKDDDAQD